MIINQSDLVQESNNKEIIEDSIYFSQDPVKNSSGFDSPIITNSFQNSHKAIDITGPIGTKIYSVMPGKVFYEGNDKKMGNVIVVSHENGYITKYMHNKENFVQTGESISLNKPIAEMGKTGFILSKKEGIHLHFELWENGNPINPFPFIKELDLIDSNLSELKK
jgi:murein DD-endopeptidase MepM/ murein hydrolase activator NlpD